MANANNPDWDRSVLGSGFVPVWLRPFGYRRWHWEVVPWPGPCELEVLKGWAWFLGGFWPLPSWGWAAEWFFRWWGHSWTRNDGEMWALGWSLHRMKAENTPQSRLGDQRGLGPREKLCFVQEFCAENCTPRSTWSCKTEHCCKHKACLLFFPLTVVQRQHPGPPEGLDHSCGSGMTAYGWTGRSAALSDLRGGEQFYFPSLSRFPFRFYIPHWQTGSRSGQGVPQALAPGHESIGTKAFLVHTVRTGRCRWPGTLLIPPRSRQRWWIELQVFVKEGLELHT